MRLCKALAPVDEVASVDYFSALAHWDNDKVIKHSHYVKALRNSGVSVHMGSFADKEKIGLLRSPHGTYRVSYFNQEFSAYRRRFYTHEEKQTDVAIGVKMYKNACLGDIGKIVLLSNDTDFVPALREISQDFPSIRLKVYAPTQADTTLPSSVRQIVGKRHHKHLPVELVSKSQFPPKIRCADGSLISVPEAWQ